MNIQIHYGTGVAPLPIAALPSLDRANKADIKLLFLLCAESSLLCGEDRHTCLSRIAARMEAPVTQVEASLAFWRGTGVLDIYEDAPYLEKEPPAYGAETPSDAGSASEAPSEAEGGEAVAAPESRLPEIKVTRAKTRMLDEIPLYTSVDLENFFRDKSEAATYLHICQETWGNLFNARDMSTVMALVEQWGFSWEYVVSLIAYAEKHFRERENQGKTLNYVYRMAVSFHKEGITTVEALQEKFLQQEKMSDFEKHIRVMFGLGNRNLTPKEKKYFSTWLYEYRYGIEEVELAYNVTVDAKGSPNAGYMNGVLKHWYEDGLRTAEEIAAKLETDAQTVRGIKEGKLTPDNAKEAVATALRTASAEGDPSGTGNLSQDIGILRRLLSLGNRLLTDGELSAMTRWRKEYGFTYEIIYRAYQITLENRREYNLPYMDAILKKWYELQLTTPEAIAAYDKGFHEDKQKKKATGSSAPRGDGSFETGDFFMAAVKRSFGEDFDPDILKQ